MCMKPWNLEFVEHQALKPWKIYLQLRDIKSEGSRFSGKFTTLKPEFAIQTVVTWCNLSKIPRSGVRRPALPFNFSPTRLLFFREMDTFPEPVLKDSTSAILTWFTELAGTGVRRCQAHTHDMARHQRTWMDLVPERFSEPTGTMRPSRGLPPRALEPLLAHPQLQLQMAARPVEKHSASLEHLWEERFLLVLSWCPCNTTQSYTTNQTFSLHGFLIWFLQLPAVGLLKPPCTFIIDGRLKHVVVWVVCDIVLPSAPRKIPNPDLRRLLCDFGTIEARICWGVLSRNLLAWGCLTVCRSCKTCGTRVGRKRLSSFSVAFQQPPTQTWNVGRKEPSQEQAKLQFLSDISPHLIT